MYENSSRHTPKVDINKHLKYESGSSQNCENAGWTTSTETAPRKPVTTPPLRTTVQKIRRTCFNVFYHKRHTLQFVTSLCVGVCCCGPTSGIKECGLGYSFFGQSSFGQSSFGQLSPKPWNLNLEPSIMKTQVHGGDFLRPILLRPIPTLTSSTFANPTFAYPALAIFVFFSTLATPIDPNPQTLPT